MKTKKMSEFYSDDRLATSLVIKEDERVAVLFYLNKTEVRKHYKQFSTIHAAQNYAEDLIYNYENKR